MFPNIPVTLTVTVNRLVYGSRCAASYVAFQMDPKAAPVFVHIGFDGNSSSSDKHDPTMLVNAQCTITGTLTTTNPNDVLALVNGSPEIYVTPMIAEAEKQAAAKGFAIIWI